MTADQGRPSGALVAHVQELPFVRRSIFQAVRAFAAGIPGDTRVLDAGAGEAPYAELFAHCEYVTADWPNSVHAGGRSAQIVASLQSLPVPAGSFGAVLCTEVLEHIPQPETVLAELSRVLAPGGRICVTVPFVWPLHEEPFDFYRYTPHALTRLLAQAGFVEVSVAPRTGFTTTLAQLAEMTSWLYPARVSGIRALQVRASLRLLRTCARPLMWLARRDPALDRELEGVPLPLGYLVLASKPRADESRPA